MSYGGNRRKQSAVQVISVVQCEKNPIENTEQQDEENVGIVPISLTNVAENNSVENRYTNLVPEMPIITLNVVPIEKKNISSTLGCLRCYCDGSYSYRNRIGYSGFRASNGCSRYCLYRPRNPRHGSMESEVFAAYLALEYTAKHHYKSLILYTDNSKVEQLLTRPKKKDYKNYPIFFTMLNRCHIKDGFSISVKRVRGHTTWCEQQQCPIKREFAKTDRQVRQKLRKYIRQQNSILSHTFINRQFVSLSLWYSY